MDIVVRVKEAVVKVSEFLGRFTLVNWIADNIVSKFPRISTAVLAVAVLIAVLNGISVNGLNDKYAQLESDCGVVSEEVDVTEE